MFGTSAVPDAGMMVKKADALMSKRRGENTMSMAAGMGAPNSTPRDNSKIAVEMQRLHDLVSRVREIKYAALPSINVIAGNRVETIKTAGGIEGAQDVPSNLTGVIDFLTHEINKLGDELARLQ